MDCPRCGKQILLEDIHAANRLAKCRFCDEIFRTDTVAEIPSDQPAFVPSIARISCPADTWTEESPGRKIIGRSFGRVTVGVCLLAILWIAFAGCGSVLIFGRFFAENKRTNLAEWLMESACLVFAVLVSVFIPYCLLCHFVNRRIVTFSDAELSVWIGPIPCGGNLHMNIKNMRHFYGHRVLVHGEETSALIEVHALFTDGTHRKVLRLLQGEESQFYVQQLNQWLGNQAR